MFDGNVKNLSLLSLNLSLREKPVLEPERQTLFSSYPDIVSFDVFAMPLPELLAEKIRTIDLIKREIDQLTTPFS